MTHFREELPMIYLRPGEIHVAEKPVIVSTVLGSCIAVTMFHRRFGVGVVCHALLPYGECKGEWKYMNCAIQRMVKKFDSLGPPRREIEVKLFGGSDMFDVKRRTDGALSIGKQNIKAANKVLREERLRVMVSDVGGPLGRKIFFNTLTGEVFLKRLKREEAPGLE